MARLIRRTKQAMAFPAIKTSGPFKFTRISLNMFLLSIMLATFASCNGQDKKPAWHPAGQTVFITPGDTISELGKNIDCIFQDRNKNWWFASNGDGVYRYDGKTLRHLTERDGLLSNFVWTIQQDTKGNLWFTTPDGICQFDGLHFTDYTDRVKNAPFGKWQYTSGGLFFGHVNGICFYDGTAFTNFRISPDDYHPSSGDMNRPYSVYSTLVDKQGNAWFGTQSEGVCRFDGKTITYLTGKNLAGYAVRAIFQDKSGNLWFGNNGGGLYRYDGKTLSNLTDENQLGNPEFLKGHFSDKPGSMARVWTINEDDEGNLFAGTIDAGVWKFDGTGWTNYTTKDGLAGNAIWTIYKDRDGELWFVSGGEAICTFNGSTFRKVEFK